MNKKSFINEYRKKTSHNGEIKNLKEARMDLEVFFETLKVGLLKDGEVKLQKKGKFKILQKKERVISNPSTRERMTITPPKTVKFVIAKNIIMKINEMSK